MKVSIIAGASACLGLLVLACNSQSTTETRDSGASGGAGGSDSAVEADSSNDADSEVDADSEADADTGAEETGGTGGGPAEGVWECTAPNREKNKITNGEYSCGLNRCIPGSGCIVKCESDDDCVTIEELGGDPSEYQIYCDDSSRKCNVHKLTYEPGPD